MTTLSTNAGSPASDQQAIAEIMDGVRTVVRALRINTRAIEKQMGISLAQLWVLQILDQGPADSLNELAVATVTHQSSVSVVVRRLVERQLATRAPVSADKRRVRIQITDAGKSLLGKAPPTVQVSLIAALRRMSPERRGQLASLMTAWLSDAGLDLTKEPPMLMEDDAEGGNT